jgi:hypothetical protein
LWDPVLGIVWWVVSGVEFPPVQEGKETTQACRFIEEYFGFFGSGSPYLAGIIDLIINM